MIPIDRPQASQAIRDALDKRFPATADSAEETELERARAYYTADPPPTRAFDFKRYKEHVVRKALDDMCHDKCAYCESVYRAVDSRDVEHYRPKGKVAEAPAGNQGYWWLAAEWSNLLPSCPPCNQRRRQVEFKPGMTLEELEAALHKRPVETSGKSNAFPVRGDNWITRESQSTNVEDPLLINPCERDPREHLEWHFDWDQSTPLWDAEVSPMVLPKKIANDQDDPYAEASIGVYGLNRAGLFRERKERVQEIRVFCRPVVDTAKALLETEPADRQPLISQLQTYKRLLYGFAAVRKPYSAMVSAFIEVFETELKGNLSGSSPNG